MTINEIDQIEFIVSMVLLAGVAALLLYCWVGMMNRRVQLCKIREYNKDVKVFIREVPQVSIGEVTQDVTQYITYSPHYKRAVCADSGNDIEFVNECIICDFPSDTDYTNLEQVNTLLLFWKKQNDAKYSKKYIDHDLYRFRSEEDKEGFWKQYRKEQQSRDLSLL